MVTYLKDPFLKTKESKKSEENDGMQAHVTNRPQNTSDICSNKVNEFTANLIKFIIEPSNFAIL